MCAILRTCAVAVLLGTLQVIPHDVHACSCAWFVSERLVFEPVEVEGARDLFLEDPAGTGMELFSSHEEFSEVPVLRMDTGGMDFRLHQTKSLAPDAEAAAEIASFEEPRGITSDTGQCLRDGFHCLGLLTGYGCLWGGGSHCNCPEPKLRIALQPGEYQWRRCPRRRLTSAVDHPRGSKKRYVTRAGRGRPPCGVAFRACGSRG